MDRTATEERVVLSPEARVDAICEHLGALGFTFRVIDEATCTRIEMEVPDRVPAESWHEFLATLTTADQWGAAHSGKSGRTAWAAVAKETPATVTAVRGRGRQL
ncbi:hypothetical protein [Streptomyces sp. UNOC14_S4]|uniref:hypothetical protein n=1 Tax=Streptomyces sp. UNOC14_S4 TaxID=2872340 RepID=UPI001E453B42|nr:hypothetical protein [Streptomyces sp. UNOC14_S4]MCC3769394.1 hypothetical protein [Streptomyces sp. UNOC14_S4]